MIEKIVVRHAESEANKNFTKIALGAKDAELTNKGVEQAKRLRDAFEKIDGISELTPVAVSSMTRARQTAEIAGFKNIHERDVLDEISIPKFNAYNLATVPTRILENGFLIMENMPEEEIWFTHFLAIESLKLQLSLRRGKIEKISPRKGILPPHGSVMKMTFRDDKNEKL